MIQATIDNSVIETFLYEKFNGDQKKITSYINDFLYTYLPKGEHSMNFEADRKRFHETYKRMQGGTEEMLSEEESNLRTENFLKNI